MIYFLLQHADEHVFDFVSFCSRCKFSRNAYKGVVNLKSFVPTEKPSENAWLVYHMRLSSFRSPQKIPTNPWNIL